MSMLLMVKAMQLKVGNPLRKLVLLKLADNANDNGECWPSYQHIADQCEIARSTVKAHIRALEEAGLLRREFRRNGDMNQSNVFHLTLDVATQKAWGGAADARGVGRQMPGGGAADNPGGGAADNPRTSHSLEPVKEPEAELSFSAPNPPRKRKKPVTDFPKDFSVTKEMAEWFYAEGLGDALDLGEATQDWADGVRAKGLQYADWNIAWRKNMRLQNKWAMERKQR